MLDTAEAVHKNVDLVDSQWLSLTANERQLIQLFRLIAETERRQVRRLIDQLATHPDESED